MVQFLLPSVLQFLILEDLFLEFLFEFQFLFILLEILLELLLFVLSILPFLLQEIEFEAFLVLCEQFFLLPTQISIPIAVASIPSHRT